MNLLKQPSWLRALEIITGIMSIILGITVLIYPDWGVATLIVWLSVGLMFIGIRSIALVGVKGLSNGSKALSVISGILSVILAFLVIIFPDYGVATLIWFVAFGLLIYGFTMMYLAYVLKETPGYTRGWMVAIGVLDVILSVLVLVLPGASLLTLVIILAVVLLVSGVEMIVSGAIGRTWLGNVVESIKKEVRKE